MKRLLATLAAALAAVSLYGQNTLAGNLTVQQTVKLLGTVTPAQLTANVNDYAPTGFSTAATVRLSSDNLRTITGLAGGVAGRTVTLMNIGEFAITLATESSSSAASNRFALGTTDFALPKGSALTFWYDGASARWRATSSTLVDGTATDQVARDAAAAAQATADSKQDALANAGTLAKVTEAAGLPLWDGGAWPGGGDGTVKSVSVTTANGVSGTVSNPTTTPAITLALGAITPTSVAATGTVTGSNLSGTNTGDQSDATLTFSDVTTNNVSTSRHGFAPKAPDDTTKFLNGTGAWSVPVHNSTASIQGGTTGEAYHLTSAQHTEAGNFLSNSVTGTAGIQQVQMDTTTVTANPNTTGLISWDTVAGTLQIGMVGGKVTMQAGQEMPFRCRNNSGVVIPEGSAVVLVGWASNTPSIALASNTTYAGAMVFGVATEDISNNAFGYVTIVGAVRGLNTSGMIQGALVWVGADGSLTTSRPVSPAYQTAVGWCLYSHATEGIVMVNHETFRLLSKLSDVRVTDLVNGQILKWNASATTWDNVTLTKSDVGLSNVENTALSTWAGTSNVTTLGTVTTGTWNAAAIADSYISSAATWNAKVSFPGFGTTGTTACVGNDARLSDARTPLAHTQAWSTITATPTTLSGYGITDAQPLDSDLTALAGLSTTGLVARTGAGTSATRTITGTANQITVTNGDGVAGNPTLSLPQDIATTSSPTFAGSAGISMGELSGVRLSTYNGSAARIGFGINLYGGGGGYENSIFAGGTSDENGRISFGRYRTDTSTYTERAVIYCGSGYMGIGTVAPASMLDVRGTIRAGAYTAPTVGSGTSVEIAYDGSEGIIQAYDRTNSVGKPLWLNVGIGNTLLGGNVGVGTNTPIAKLDVYGTTDTEGVLVRNATGSNWRGYYIGASNSDSLTYGRIDLNIQTGELRHYVGPYAYGGFQTFYTAGTERMRLSSDGNVGIGTNTPSALLSLYRTTDAQLQMFDGTVASYGGGIRGYSVSAQGGRLGLGTVENTAYAERITIDHLGNVGIGTNAPSAKLEVWGSSPTLKITQNPGASGGATLSLTAAGSGAATINLGGATLQCSTASSALFLNPSGGYVGIGTDVPSAQLHTTGAVRFANYGAGTLVTDSSGNVTASSDASLKTITGSFTRGLADVLKLTPRTYRWNEKSGMNTEDENVGFIAQEVLESIPEAVGQYRTSEVEVDGKKTKKREKAELLTLSDRPLIAALVNAVKELKSENDELRNRIDKLEAKK